MTKALSYCHRRWPISKIIYALVLVACLTSCGPHSQLHGFNGFASGMSGPGQGPASDSNNGNSTVRISPDAEVQQMKDAVGSTEKNKSFAANIESAQISTDDPKKVEIQIDVKDSPTPLVFTGSLSQKDSNYLGEFTEISGTRPDLRLDVSCHDQNCGKANLVLKNDNGDQAGMLVTSRDEDLELVVPNDESARQVHQDGLDTFGNDTEIKWTSTEVIPEGTTSYVVRNKSSNEVLFKGKVNETDDGFVPVDVPSSAQKNVNVTLAGISSDESVWQVSKSKTSAKPNQGGSNQNGDDAPVAFYRAKNKNPTTLVQANTESCPVRIYGGVHPLINKILKEDCPHPEIQKAISEWKICTKKHCPKTTLTDYINLYNESKTTTVPGRAMEFREMLNILYNNKLPQGFSFVTIAESNFDKMKIGPDKERGVWQLSTDMINKYLHNSTALALQIKAATTVASQYYQTFLDPVKGWGDNQKMVLASYNAGLGGTKNSLLGRHRYTDDFWEMCRSTLNTHIKHDTCPYVKKIEAAIIISLDPEGAGFGPLKAIDAI